MHIHIETSTTSLTANSRIAGTDLECAYEHVIASGTLCFIDDNDVVVCRTHLLDQLSTIIDSD